MTLYSKPNCPPCANLKYWLKKKNINYKEEDITNHIDELSAMGFMAAPVVKIGDRYMSGVRLTDVASALNLS